MGLVAHHLEVVDGEVLDVLHLPLDEDLGEGPRCPAYHKCITSKEPFLYFYITRKLFLSYILSKELRLGSERKRLDLE